MKSRDEELKLENQLCFLLYTCARFTSRYYRHFMDEMGLTYTQYLTMLVLWEEKQINVKKLGERLYLDSGTLTPVLKKLEEKGYIRRERMTSDERNVLLCVTEEGVRLKDLVYEVYQRMESWQPLSPERDEEARSLFDEIIAEYKEKMRDEN